MEIPRFNFSNCSIKTDEELNAVQENSKKEDKFFKPGKYEVVIDSVEYTGQAPNDPNWGKLTVTYKGTGEKTIKDFLLIPFADVKYGVKGTLYPFRKIQKFGQALGTEVTVKTVEAAMKQLFANPVKLKGRAVGIEVGYEKGHVKYMGKTPEGSKQYSLADRDGNPIRDNAMNVAVFPDFDAAYAYAEENKIPVDRFPRILDYAQSSLAAAAPAKSDW